MLTIFYTYIYSNNEKKLNGEFNNSHFLGSNELTSSYTLLKILLSSSKDCRAEVEEDIK